MTKQKKQAILIQIPNMDKYGSQELGNMLDILQKVTTEHLGVQTTVVLFPMKITIMDEGAIRDMIDTLENVIQ